MRLAVAALCAAVALAPAAEAGKRTRGKPRVTVLKKTKGRAHVPAWLFAPIAPATIPVPEPAPAPAEAPPAGQEPAPPAPAPPAQKFHRSGVDLDEYSLLIARNPLDAGTIELVARNFGEDDHDLALSRDGALIAKTEVIAAGAEATLTAQLSAGTYKLYCSLLDHDAKGMNRGLVVRET